MLEIQETFVNQTKGYQYGNTDWYEPYMQNRQKLFKDLQKEYGRCVSKMYIDLPDGKVERVGWLFEKKMKYEDARRGSNSPEDFYVREVWVQYREVEEETEE